MHVTREKVAFAFTVAAVVASAAVGCVSNDNGAAPGDDAGTPPTDSSTPPTDSTTPQDAAPPPVDSSGDVALPDAGPAPALIRVAWFVGGVPTSIAPPPEVARKLGTGVDAAVAAPAYDVCVAPHGTGAWEGPLLAASSFAAGLQAFDVTAYFPVAAGRYDVRIVVAGSATCELPDAGSPPGTDAGDAGEDAGVVDAGSQPSTDFMALPAIASGSALTVVLVDPLNPGTSIADYFAFTDDTAASSGMAKLRFVNVSENDETEANPVDAGPDADLDAGPTYVGADFGLGGGILFDPLFTNVTSHEQLDPTATNGYREVSPLVGVDSTMFPLSDTEPSNTDYLGTPSLTLPAGAIFTAFYATESSNGRKPVIVWCYDGQPSATSSALTRCGHADVGSDAEQSYTRFGDFSADGVARDVCVKYHSYGNYTGPLLTRDGVDGGTGIPAQFLSAYFNLHGGFLFDARFVNAGATDCSVGVAPDTTYTAHSEPGGGGYTSLLLTGYANVPGDAGTIPPYDAGPPATFEDDAGATIDAGPQPTSGALTTLATSVVVIEDEAFVTPAVPGLRLVHLAATHPDPITMQVSSGSVVVVSDASADDVSPLLRPLASTAWAFTDVPYGGFSTRPGPIDPFGYETMVSGALSITIETTNWSYTMNPDQTSMFAFDGAGGLALLACNDYFEDSAPQDLLYADDCCVVGSTCASAVQPTMSGSRARTRRLVRSLPGRHPH